MKHYLSLTKTLLHRSIQLISQHIKTTNKHQTANALALEDEELLRTVREHQLKANLLNINQQIVSLQFHKNISDCQAMFLAFSYNIYHDRLKPDTILTPILDNIKHKLKSHNFAFSSPEQQQHYLEQLLFLTHRNTLSQHQLKELTAHYYSLLQHIYDINSINRDTPTQQSIDKLWSILPYLPKQTKTALFLDSLEQTFLNVLQQFATTPIAQQSLAESINRINKLRQFCIRLSNCRNKPINAFKHLPYQFKTEENFANFMQTLKQFVTPTLISKTVLTDMNHYHHQLASNNKLYRSTKTYQCMENYCENLVFFNMYRPTDFVQYFDPQGPEYVDIDSRFKK